MDEFLPNYRLQYDLRFWQHVHCAEIKVQKTNKRQGYHVWHMEHDSHYANRNRVLHGHYILMMSKKAVRQSFYINLFEYHQ